MKITESAVSELPVAIDKVLKSENKIKNIAQSIYKKEHVFFIGRGIDYYTALEASLKLKEISYIHSEAYAAGELKHGTISLIEEKTPVIAVSTNRKLREKMVSNIREVRARGAYVISICSHDAYEFDGVSDEVYRIPDVSDEISHIVCATVFQILSYYTAKMRGCDIDRPRNLAKSVTVE